MFTVAGSHDLKKKDSANSVQSSLNSHPLRVILYILAEVLDVVRRGIFLIWKEKIELDQPMLPPVFLRVPSKKFSPFGPAIWPALF